MSISIMKQDARVPATHVLVIPVLHVHIMDSVLCYPEYIEIKTLLTSLCREQFPKSPLLCAKKRGFKDVLQGNHP